MAKFINTQVKENIKSLNEGAKSGIQGGFFAPTNVKNSLYTTYLHQNIEKSTLDPGSEIAYAKLGKNSPIKYDMIKDFVMFNVQTLLTQLENTDFGMEIADIEGDLTVLPDTIKPIPNDYFIIDYVGKMLLFRVVDSTPDIINVEHGNYWKIDYVLEKEYTYDDLDPSQIVNNKVMMVNNTTKQYKMIIDEKDYDYIADVENILEDFIDYYNEMFYSDRVESYIFTINDKIFYDPYLTEFIIKNKLLDSAREYAQIYHQTTLSPTFNITYGKTFFKMLETKNNKKEVSSVAIGRAIDEPLSIMYMRNEDYFQVVYENKFNRGTSFDTRFQTIPLDFLERVKNNNQYQDIDKSDQWMNIVIKYMNDESISMDDINLLDNLEFDTSRKLFYIIPCVIFVIRESIKNILK